MRTEDVIHQGLECGGCIRKTKGEHNELIEAIPRAERRLGDVLLLDANLVVAGTKVDLGEVPRTVETIQEVVNARDRVPVLDGDLVEGTVVHTQAEGSILLLHKEDWRSTVGCARSDEALAHVLLKLLEQLLVLLVAHPVRWQVGHLPTGLEVDGMIHLSLGGKAREVVGEDILELLKDGLGFKGHT